MIVATVGHVDHGKTALVRALTGVETDRLPEEQARGMSIELGFAYRATPAGASLGFVDVPGHERFVRTMVAGVAGIDHALVVVAADDGPMPQTREHLSILDLLEVRGMTMVVTKIDRVDAARASSVEAALRALLPPPAQGAPAFHVCATRGTGVEALAAHLDALADAWALPAAEGQFRMSVDRSFALPGAGLVVTGTVLAGEVEPDAPLVVMPGARNVRVRSVQAGHRAASRARAGERCALALAGPEATVQAVRRGDWVVDPRIAAATRAFDAVLRLLPGAAPLRHETRVHLHLGAGENAARVTPLGAPRDDGMQRAAIATDAPVAPLWGDRFVIRDWSAQHTLGGGRVLDPAPPARGRHTAPRLAQLGALECDDPRAALAALLECQPEGVDVAGFARARNLDAAQADAVFTAVSLVRVGPERDAPAVSLRTWTTAGERLLAALDAWHRIHPGHWGPGESELRNTLEPRPGAALFGARLRALVADGAVLRRGNRVYRRGHAPVLDAAQRTLWERIEPRLLEGGMRPAPIGHLAPALGLPIEAVDAALREFADLGFLLQVADNRYYPPQALAQLAREARALAEAHEDGLFGAAEYRDRTGIGRNLTIKVLEYFDRCGFTRRVGERRRLLRPPEQVFGGQARPGG